MNEDQPMAEKAITGSLNQSCRSIENLKEGLESYRSFINRIEQEKLSPPSEIKSVQQSFGELSLTGKIRYIEENLGLVLNEFKKLNDRFNSLV